MNLTPTNHPKIFSSEWFTDASHPLIQTKVFYSKLGNLLYYTTVHRGPTTDDVASSPDEVKTLELNDSDGMSGDEQEAFNKLVSAIEKKA